MSVARRWKDLWKSLRSLTYKTQTQGDIVLPIQEVIQRISDNQLATVRMFASRINRKYSVVKDILFSSSLELHVSESINLQMARVLTLSHYRIIDSYRQDSGKRIKAHYRAYANDSRTNNFESLPRFDPTD